MAAKRSLYKPAQLENVGSKESRSPLVQGHLVTKPVIPDTMTVYASPAVDITHEIINDTSITTVPQSGYSTPPRHSLANLSRQSHESFATASNLSQRSPRSPAKPTPSDILDLSDGDTDKYSAKPSIVHVQHPSTSPILMVDAGGRRRDPDVSEVEITTDLVTSPAKVICHAPAVVESDLRNTGYTQEATKIQVDSIPSVSLHSDLDVTTDQPITRENSLSQRNTSVASVSKDNSDTTMSGAIPSQQKKKKPKGRVVSSRYMQSSTVSAKMKTTTANQSSTNVSRRGTSCPDTFHKPQPSVRPATKSVIRKTSSRSARASKPSVSDTTILTERKGARSRLASKPSLSETLAMGGKMSSTPAINMSKLPTRSEWDASAIQPIHGMSMLMNDDISMIESSMLHKGDADVSDVFHSASHHKKHSKEPEITQDYLDRVYARYLQWVYVDSKQRKSFQEQEKDAVGQMFALVCENEKMRVRQAELEQEMATIKHENHLDQLLELQRAGLGPITANIDPYRSQYSTMAHALDTTRHQLPVKGIHVPENEDQYQDAMIAALDESEQLLQQLNLTVGSNQGSKVSSFAKALNTLEHVVDNEDKELKRCQELLAAMSSLTAHASSLQIQQLEQTQDTHRLPISMGDI